MVLRKNSINANCYAIVFLVLMLFFAPSAMASGSSSGVLGKIIGVWQFDELQTMKLRITKGVPWHIGDRYGMGGGGKVIREFGDAIFKFYNEETGRVIDEGKYQIIESGENEVVLRIYPEDDSFDANELKFDELVKFSREPGENIPYVIGLRYVDDNTLESFSYVRDFGKDKMIKKDDHAYWKRIEKVPGSP